MILVILLISTGVAADKKNYPSSPPAQISKKWRIGYLEGGYYKDYPKVLIATVEGLIRLGWIENIAIPPQMEKEGNTAKLWSWMASDVKSKYLEFAADAHYSADWKNDLRDQTKKRVLKR
ncbi:MAG: hypothetical protein HC887_13400 [Desulfobacteraceae bacterium]|nr:hypothetical protein [Desulfobacteraceae bacterium]